VFVLGVISMFTYLPFNLCLKLMFFIDEPSSPPYYMKQFLIILLYKKTLVLNFVFELT